MEKSLVHVGDFSKTVWRFEIDFISKQIWGHQASLGTRQTLQMIVLAFIGPSSFARFA
jgi:hypothetical protein